MINDILLYGGAGIIALWGIAHIVATRGVISSFEGLSSDNMKIITMEWIAEGITLVFIGTLVISVRSIGTAGCGYSIVYYACAGMLIIMAILSAFTGARTKIIPMKLCPYIKTFVAAMFVAGILV